MNVNNIRAAFEKRIAALSGVPEIDYENVTYKPVIGTPYLRVRLIPANNLPAGVGVDAPNRSEGIFTIDIFRPTNDGSQSAGTLAQSIIDQFARGSTLTESGTSVKIKNTEIRSAPIESGDWYLTPITVNWFCFE